MTRSLVALLSISMTLLAAPSRALGAEEAPPTPEQLAARERIRPKFEAILKDIHTPSKPGEKHPNYFVETAEALVGLGPEAVPFLAAELDLMDPPTFHFCAYALGRLGGQEAEAALTKALRRSEERGGGFGSAAKRLALFGLALAGRADVVDQVQTGIAIPGAEMYVELPLIAQLAMLTAPDSVPLLVKQLDTASADPGAAESLRWTLVALAHVGDASLVPKVLPLLDRTSPEVRGEAAHVLGQFGTPAICGKLTAKLGDRAVRADYALAAALERLNPSPCAKDLLARLEVEKNLDVRAYLYRTLASIQGEAALELLRTGYARGGNAEKVVVLGVLGRIGSTKGLNLARTALPEKDVSVALAALDALAKIGGEGAIDTLLAVISDPRRSIALEAVRHLSEIGEKRAGPRVAQRLLEIVREPVGDLATRPAVAKLSEALVTFGFTDPAEELKSAAAIQTDPEIRDDLAACAKQLDRLKTSGRDVALWAADLAGGDPGLRRLAARRLAEIGSPEAVAALETRLGPNDLAVEDRAAILRAVADARAQWAAPIVERHLSDGAFDSWLQRPARREAAWAARRLGGVKMIAALRASAVRRDGRDWGTLVGLALLDPAHAAETLAPLRVKRLRYIDSRNGIEDRQIDEILWSLSGHHTIARFDVPPETLFED